MKPSSKLVDLILSLSSKQEARDFLLDLLTPQELQQLEQRLKIVTRLKSGVPQRQIADELGVGIATVTRGSRILHDGRAYYV